MRSAAGATTTGFVLAMLAGVPTVFSVRPAAAQEVPEQVIIRPSPVPPPRQNYDTACTPEGALQGAGVPLTVEVRDDRGPYESAHTTTLSDREGRPLIGLGCEGPINVFRVEPGTYQVQAFVGRLRSDLVPVNVPSAGGKVILIMKPPPGAPRGREPAE